MLFFGGWGGEYVHGHSSEKWEFCVVGVIGVFWNNAFLYREQSFRASISIILDLTIDQSIKDAGLPVCLPV